MLESTIYGNCQLVINSEGTPVAYQRDGIVRFTVGDRVLVRDDGYGFICCGISQPGYGRIVEIVRDSTDHHFHVVMDNGESGYAKEARLRHV